jgi:hypothetical protein
MTCGKAKVAMGASHYELHIKKSEKTLPGGKISRSGNWQGYIQCRPTCGRQTTDSVRAVVDLVRLVRGVTTRNRYYNHRDWSADKETLTNAEQTCAVLEAIVERVCAWNCMDEDFKTQLREEQTKLMSELMAIARSMKREANAMESAAEAGIAVMNKKLRVA